MTEDELLEALKQAARERAREEEQASLSAESAGELDALLQPLGEDFVEGVLDDLFAPSEQAPGPQVERAAEAPPIAADPPAANTPSRWPRILAVLGAIGAVAAVLLVFTALPQSVSSDLPAYEFEVMGGDQALRNGTSQPGSKRVLTPGSALTVSARPPADLPDALDATVFVRAGGVLTESPLDAEIAASGAVRWRGTAGRPPLVAGVDQVVLVVHHPDADAATVLAAAAGEGGLPTHRVEVEIQP